MADLNPQPEGPWTYRVTFVNSEGREDSFETVPSRDKPEGDPDAVRRLVLKTNKRLAGVDPSTVRVSKIRPSNAADLNRYAMALRAVRTKVTPPSK